MCEWTSHAPPPITGNSEEGAPLESFVQIFKIYTFVVQLPSCVRFLMNPWTTAYQASLSFTMSQSLLKLMSIKSVMPSNHLVLCHPLLLLPPVFPSIRFFSSESTLHIRWPNYSGLIPGALQPKRKYCEELLPIYGESLLAF